MDISEDLVCLIRSDVDRPSSFLFSQTNQLFELLDVSAPHGSLSYADIQALFDDHFVLSALNGSRHFAYSTPYSFGRVSVDGVRTGFGKK